MGDSCQKQLTEEAEQWLKEAEERVQQDRDNILGWEEYQREMPAIEAAIAEKEAAINEKIDSVARYIDGVEPVRAKDIMLIHDSPSKICPEPDASRVEEFMQRVQSADPKTVIIPLGKETKIY